MDRGNSFAHGQALGNGSSYANGPCAQYRRDGWDYRPVTFWDLVEGRDPA